MRSIQEDGGKGYLDSFAYNCPIDAQNTRDFLHCRCYRSKRAWIGRARPFREDFGFVISKEYGYLNDIICGGNGQCCANDVIFANGGENYDE